MIKCLVRIECYSLFVPTAVSKHETSLNLLVPVKVDRVNKLLLCPTTTKLSAAPQHQQQHLMNLNKRALIFRFEFNFSFINSSNKAP